MSRIVVCFAADGRSRDVRVTAESDAQAARIALDQLRAEEPGAGWRAGAVL